MNIAILAILLFFSALFSGLNLGYFSLNLSDLEIEKKMENKKAIKILSLRRQSNWLLSTLILCNVAVNAVIPLILNSYTEGIMAAVFSIVFITIFGEILPQSLCARYALDIGSFFAPVVRALMYLTYPVSKPLGILLDKVVGTEKSQAYSKEKMHHFIDHTGKNSDEIDSDEVNIIHGSLNFSDRTVLEVMTPWEDVTSLRDDFRITPKRLREINTEGHSRIPIWHNNKNAVIGILYLKDLVGAEGLGDAKNLMREDAVFHVAESEKLDNVLNHAIRNRIHIFIVRDEEERTTGIITLEDIMEEILNQEIIDETDLDEIE